MKTVEIKLWDDVHAKKGARVQADETVTLEYASPRLHGSVRLDLSADHGKELDELLASWLEAGQGADAPMMAHGKAGSKEARDFYAGLRAWAKSVGRDGEHWTKGRGDRPPQYYYPRSLVQDYEAYLIEQAERQAS